ncbi:MAG TPA: efflux RND transporter permease subunit [Nevskiaceae bacterium]|nr:efflux RND transporter permease subunit [Nevskiaceae bacterium]
MTEKLDFIERGVNWASDLVIKLRHPLSILFIAVTIGLGYSAAHIRLDPGFLKMIPIDHPYMKTMFKYMKDFSGADTILVNLHWTGKGTIYNKSFMDALQSATNEVFLIPGINRTQVSSLFTPNVYYIRITAEGFDGHPVIPPIYTGTPAQLQQIRGNVQHSGQIGILVANNAKSAMIRASLLDSGHSTPAAAARFYGRVIQALGDTRGLFESKHQYTYTLAHDQDGLKRGLKIGTGYVDYGWMRRFQTFYYQPPGGGSAIGISGSDVDVKVAANPHYDPHIKVNIIGFTQLLADVINGLLGVFAFFGLAFVVTALLLFWYNRSWHLTLVALVAALLPVLWLLGILPLIGYGVDPLSILVPFLIFSIGTSHAVQMTNAWRQATVAGADPIEASRHSLQRLLIPGCLALLTNALGFAVIMLIDIPIVKELGISACIGVLLMLITNKAILPIMMTHIHLEEGSRHFTEDKANAETAKIWKLVARCAEPRVALGVFVVSLILLGVTTGVSRQLVIGDSGVGASELRADSRYNRDSRLVDASYNIGVNVLGVVVEAPHFSGGSCLHYPVVHLVDEFDLFMRGVSGVRSVTSVASIGRLIVSAFNEGSPRWMALPRSEQGLTTASRAFDPSLGLNTEGCRAIEVLVFAKDHQGATVEHIVDEAKTFIASHHVPGVRMRLATGNLGVTAATNESVGGAEAQMVGSIFLALFILCCLAFRSWRAAVCVLIPLMLVSIFCNALMATMGIGLTVPTLPVVALGVGVGVDYGIYLFEHITRAMKVEGKDFHDAFYEAMCVRGTAAVFTACTMAIGVGTWALSALNFQADMGVLLAFMFLVNMLGAICLLPALGTWFWRNTKAKPLGARP